MVGRRTRSCSELALRQKGRGRMNVSIILNSWFYILFIDLLMTVRYSHETWLGSCLYRHSRVCIDTVASMEKKASIQSTSTSKTTTFGLPMVTYAKRQCFNVSGLKKKMDIYTSQTRTRPNSVRGEAAACLRVVSVQTQSRLWRRKRPFSQPVLPKRRHLDSQW